MNAEEIKTRLKKLLEQMNQAAEAKKLQIQNLHADQATSATNLIHYLALRREDVRSLQDGLHILGLSSLASSESHIVGQVRAILERLGESLSASKIASCSYYQGRDLIKSRAAKLFGSKRDSRIPYLMVTFDIEFTDNYRLVKKLLEAGMNVARINCAHDDKAVWDNMLGLVRSASEKTGIPCKIYMDIPGPKMRVAILGKGRLLGKAVLSEGQSINLAERDADYDPSEIVIGCDEEGVIKQLRAGNRILFDDGVIEGEVLSNRDGVAMVKIIRISGNKAQLRAKKGINFPDAHLELSPLTKNDRELLPYICENADLVGYSFIRAASDIIEFQKELLKYSKRPHFILKVETSEAVKNFPALLIQSMMDDVFGVMIARGDLAVEIGFERLSEIQEEILWICEAGHVPVIWATQVLETLNKSGLATRSEITDASYASQTECVMLNKGDYIINAIKTLRDILVRSGEHHVKKRYTFRSMKIAADYLDLKE